MKYRESQLDAKLKKWFTSDMTKAHLRRMHLEMGIFRGLNSLEINFDYPITAICGKNGAGKSTITALACCAFHNAPEGFKLPRRKHSYYTFSDFFIQHANEKAPSDVSIMYTIAYDHWKPDSQLPTGVGIAQQRRRKVSGGKWNDYDTRAHRTVVFLGIERVVPHAERSQSRSYSRSFKQVPLRGWEPKVMAAVGYVLNKTYDDFRYLVHSKYSLPLVRCGNVSYSGFNMGAGENALFDIFSVIHSAGEGALIVIDEIELGLHVEAQRRLVQQLKKVCESQKVQIICTTHSSEVLDSLPESARIYVETVGGEVRTTVGISSEYAFSKLSAINGRECEIVVEDDVANALTVAALPHHLRTRVSITEIGSANALARQLSAGYAIKNRKPILAIFDGDQFAKQHTNLGYAKSMAENADADFDTWFKNRSAYLPGERWPEQWLIKRALQIPNTLSKLFNCTSALLNEALQEASTAGKHAEIRTLALRLGLERTSCLNLLATQVVHEFDDEFTAVLLRVEQLLAGEG